MTMKTFSCLSGLPLGSEPSSCLRKIIDFQCFSYRYCYSLTGSVEARATRACFQIFNVFLTAIVTVLQKTYYTKRRSYDAGLVSRSSVFFLTLLLQSYRGRTKRGSCDAGLFPDWTIHMFHILQTVKQCGSTEAHLLLFKYDRTSLH